MLDKETRTAISALASKGHNISEIARGLKVSRNSVKRVLREGTAQPGPTTTAMASSTSPWPTVPAGRSASRPPSRLARAQSSFTAIPRTGATGWSCG